MSTVEFRSKIDAWLWVVLVGAAIVSAVAAISIMAAHSPLNWLLCLLLLAVGVAMPFWILFSTKYTLTATELLIQCGPFHQRVKLSDVRGISVTRDMLAGPALSLDRLHIDYGTTFGTLISPIDKERFLVEAAARGAKIK